MRLLAAAVVAPLLLSACTGTPSDAASTPTNPAGVSKLSQAPIKFTDGTFAGLGVPLSKDEESKEVEKLRMDILIDGWSLKTLDGQVTWSAGPYEDIPLNFVPATQDDVNELLSTTPEIVEDVIARLVTPSADVSCDSSGCTASQPIDLRWITSPSEVPTFGTSYAAYGIESLLYVSSTDLQEPLPLVTLRGPQDGGAGQGVLMPLQPVQLTPGEKADSFNGWWRNRSLLAGAFGRVWTSDPQWVKSGKDFAPNYELQVAPAASDTVSQFPPPVTRFAGLAQAWPGSEGLNPSQLTYYSSPTSGCGPVALCAPLLLQPKITSIDEVLQVCAPGQPDVTISTSRSTVEVNLPGPVSQFGAWNGFLPEEFVDVPEGGGVNGGGLPPLLEGGEHSLYATTIYLWQGSDSAYVTAASGQITQFAEGQKSVDELLQEGYVLGQPYAPCG